MKQRFALFTRDDQYSKDLAERLAKELIGRGHLVDQDNPNIVVSIGGDGTFLRAVHAYVNRLDDVFFVGIRSGTLGFYTDYLDSEVDQFLADIDSWSVVKVMKLPLLLVLVDDQRYYALNEVRIENNITTLTIDVVVDDQYLETFRGNGMIVCSPGGSTAYNRSLGGPIVDHRSMVMVLTEIAGIHHNAYRALGSSLVLNGDRELLLKVTNFSSNIFGVDHSLIDREDIKEMRVTLSDKAVRVIRFRDRRFIPRIRRTLVDD